MLRRMDKPTAYDILKTYLPDRERDAIYLNDIEQMSLVEMEERLDCSESNIKKIRRSAYDRLAASFYGKKE